MLDKDSKPDRKRNQHGTMTRIILGGDGATDLTAALQDTGVCVERIPAPITADSLETAGIETAAMYVLTDPNEATSIPIAREQNPDIDVVVIAPDSLPDFANHLADLVVRPDHFEQTLLIEEITRRLIQQIDEGER